MKVCGSGSEILTAIGHPPSLARKSRVYDVCALHTANLDDITDLAGRLERGVAQRRA